MLRDQPAKNVSKKPAKLDLRLGILPPKEKVPVPRRETSAAPAQGFGWFRGGRARRPSPEAIRDW